MAREDVEGEVGETVERDDISSSNKALGDGANFNTSSAMMTHSAALSVFLDSSLFTISEKTQVHKAR